MGKDGVTDPRGRDDEDARQCPPETTPPASL
jgi:hypothetical protein